MKIFMYISHSPVGHLLFVLAEKQRLEELVYKQWAFMYMDFAKVGSTLI